MSLSKHDILIVGGGFSGTILAVQLLQRSPSLSIGIIDQSSLPGRGLAYGTSYKFHLLNVPASGMSAMPEEPDHFLRWARANYEPSIQPRSFLPRSLYGRYIGWLLQQATTNGNRERLRWYQDQALSLRRKGGNFAVQRKSGDELLAHVAVVATGNFPPANPRVPGMAEKKARYAPFAWWSGALEGLPLKGNVLLIGSGLTSVDLAITLKSRGFQGQIHMLSRRGLLPQRHETSDPWPQFWNAKSARTALELLRLVRKQVYLARQVGVNWRAVIDALRPVTQEIWKSLPVPEKRRFLRHVRTYWELHRHRIAPEIADMLADLLADGQVCIYAGRALKYSEYEQHAEVVFRDRRSGTERSLRVDRVINCTGSETDCCRIDDPFITSLFVQGFARPDPLFLGLDVDEHGALRDYNGLASRGLYALGPCRKGCLWETTAVPEIRNQAAELAEHLLQVATRRSRALHSVVSRQAI